MKTFLFLLAFVLLGATAQGQSKGASSGGSPKYIFGTAVMFMNSETQQGGAGPSGSTLLSQTDLLKSWKNLGYGIVFNYDKHGKNETDSSYGIKFEYRLDKFYFEAAYLIAAKRAYTDRSIAEETGDGMMYGFGARFPIGKGGKTSGPFFSASYKIKTQTLKKQDGVDISEPIKQSDGYPLFGFGIGF